MPMVEYAVVMDTLRRLLAATKKKRWLHLTQNCKQQLDCDVREDVNAVRQPESLHTHAEDERWMSRPFSLCNCFNL